MDKKFTDTVTSLIGFIERSQTAFQAVDEISDILKNNGFTELFESESCEIKPGGKYFVSRNSSSVIAFAVPEDFSPKFMITASHTDSPTFKLKPKCETEACGKYIKLNVEGYGGMILSTWLDRPLSIAGRAVFKKDGAVCTKNIAVKRDLVLIPNVAVHQNRQINSGFTYNVATDLMPLFSSADNKGALDAIIAEEAGCAKEDLITSDMYLYNRTAGAIWGADDEFFSSPRIDNLECAYSTLIGFTQACADNMKNGAVKVYCSFDNEETGSETKQGAGSTFLLETLKNISTQLGFSANTALASSFMISADNGHAKHPNHPEMSDSQNAPAMNDGVVIKYNASQLYTTDAVSAALFTEICKNADVPTQVFANRSDMRGGSTLGSISDTKVPLRTVDIGLAQLAMHSSYETAGCRDALYLVNAAREFYLTELTVRGNDAIEIKQTRV